MTAPTGFITDGSSIFAWVGSPDVRPFTHPVGAAYNPLGYQYTTLTADVTKRGITMTLVVLDPTEFTSASGTDQVFWAMIMGAGPFTITFPDGTLMNVGVDPATDPISTAQFSQWNWQYVNVWTIKFWEVE